MLKSTIARNREGINANKKIKKRKNAEDTGYT
jgi:hypothetical protein